MAESPHNSSIPPLSVLTDDRGATWQIINGIVRRNGTATISSSVNLLVYYNKVIYQRNSANNWWRWDNTAAANTNPWKPSFDPRGAVPTPAPAPTPVPHLPIGETKVDFYMDGKLVASSELTASGAAKLWVGSGDA